MRILGGAVVHLQIYPPDSKEYCDTLMMKVIFLPSASKHGYTEADALCAIKNYQHYLSAFEPSRIAHLPDPNLYIGPALNGDLLEVFTYVIDPQTVIFHCMKLRGKTYMRAVQNSEERSYQGD